VLAPSAPGNGLAAGNWQKSEHCWTPLRLKKRPAGGPQLRKSGGPQPRKLGGPQPRKFCSNFSNREATLQLLEQLHSVTVAEHDEVMTFIRAQKLYGWGGLVMWTFICSLPQRLTDVNFGPWTSGSKR
jgi:hypothetical protein